jgi:hypothetical protein
MLLVCIGCEYQIGIESNTIRNESYGDWIGNLIIYTAGYQTGLLNDQTGVLAY